MHATVHGDGESFFRYATDSWIGKGDLYCKGDYIRTMDIQFNGAAGYGVNGSATANLDITFLTTLSPLSFQFYGFVSCPGNSPKIVWEHQSSRSYMEAHVLTDAPQGAKDSLRAGGVLYIR